MAGNIWEWCNDWFNEREYKSRKDEIKNPQGAEKGIYRVVRGGSFRSYRRSARCAYRYGLDPINVDGNGGFRVVLESPKLENGN